MQTKYLLFILLFCSTKLWSQDTNIIATLPVANISHLDVDAFNSVYLWQENKLWCYAASGILQWAWQNPLNSTITSVDVNNPLKIAVFYREQNNIEILDKNGKLLEKIDLNALNLNDITALALAADNTLWLYDAQQRSAINILSSGEIQTKTIDLSMLTNSSLSVSSMSQINGRLCIILNNTQLLVFDTKASFIKKIETPHHSQIIKINKSDNICYFFEEKIFKKSIQNLQENMLTSWKKLSNNYTISDSLLIFIQNKTLLSIKL